MPIYVECVDLKGSLQARCIEHYRPIYDRNMSGVSRCVREMSRDRKPAREQIKCVQLYGAHCPTDKKPPEGIPVRDVIQVLFNKYIKYILPLCPKAASKSKKPPRVITAARFATSAHEYIKTT